MKVETLVVGMLEVNCYLAWDEDTGAGWVIDPGDQAGRIVQRIEKLGIKPAGILLTHGHVDHIRGVGGVAKHFGVPVWLHELDGPLYRSRENAVLPWLPPAADLPEPVAVFPGTTNPLAFGSPASRPPEHPRRPGPLAGERPREPLLHHGTPVALTAFSQGGAGIAFEVIHTPGHTPGGCCYHFAAAGFLFTGDTLFQQSIGRTDLPGGCMEDLLASITRKLFFLPPETTVFPGHGPATTLADEERTNPFLV